MREKDLETGAKNLPVRLTYGLGTLTFAGGTIFNALMIVLHEVALGVHLDANYTQRSGENH